MKNELAVLKNENTTENPDVQVFSQEPNREFNLKKRRQNSEKTKTDLLLTSEKNSLQRLPLKADDYCNSDRSTKQAYFSEINSMRKM